jgi:iron complex outermembrane receptor protein
MDLGNGFTFAVGGDHFQSSGYVQILANRLTQALIDNGTYVTGRDTTLVDLDGNGRLTPNEAQGKNFHTTWNTKTPVTIAARNTLDVGVGVTTISTRQFAISANDFDNTATNTAYMDLGKDFGSSRVLKLQLFYDDLNNARFFGYGFPGKYKSSVNESRLSYAFPVSFQDWFTSSNVVGAGYRYYSGDKKESYLGGFTGLDRRDIAFGATATDIFDDPFSFEPGGIGQTFETQVHSTWHDAGVFGVTDMQLGKRLDITLAARYDDYAVRSRDDGTVVFAPVVVDRNYSAGKGDWTYSLSATYRLPFGLMPYATYAKATAMELQQAGDIQPGQILNATWISDSGLREAGVKFQLLNKTLVGSLAAYRQTRTTIDGQTSLRLGTIATGVEFEFRYLINKNFSMTVSANDQKTTVKGPDTTSTYAYPSDVGIAKASDGYGADYRFNYSLLVPGNYTYTLVPRNVGSLYGVYTSDKYNWGTVGGALGAVYTGDTKNITAKPIDFHDHTIVNASAFYTYGLYGLTLNVTNLLDKRYYIAPTASNSAIPGLGREWRVTLKRSF